MGNLIDRTGMRYGKLTVIKRADYNTKSGNAVWVCGCDCGNVVNVNSSNLNHQKGCSCENKAVFTDITGNKYGKLTVLECASRYDKKQGGSTWLCECECGNKKIISKSHLIRGISKSCGCLVKETAYNLKFKHGYGNGDKLFHTWSNMKSRCYSKTHKAYKNYGARGITVCNEWKNDYMAFREWALNNGYKDGLSIDRIDVNGNYEPSNCRWADEKTQCNNRTNNVRITYDGETHTLAEWSKITGTNIATICSRNKKGWSPKECLYGKTKN